MQSVYRTVDAIWYALGDRSTDYNFYTKRGLLRRLNRDNGAVARLYPQERFMLMTNILRCAIHRETALTVLRRQLGQMNGTARKAALL